MPIPAAAKDFASPMDPSDEVEFDLQFEDLLVGAETIASYTVTLEPEAVALGLTVGTTTRAPSLVDAGKTIRLWLTVASGQQSDVAYTEGARLGIRTRIVTNNSPARTYERTFAVRVVQQ